MDRSLFERDVSHSNCKRMRKSTIHTERPEANFLSLKANAISMDAIGMDMRMYRIRGNSQDLDPEGEGTI